MALKVKEVNGETRTKLTVFDSTDDTTYLRTVSDILDQTKIFEGLHPLKFVYDASSSIITMQIIIVLFLNIDENNNHKKMRTRIRNLLLSLLHAYLLFIVFLIPFASIHTMPSEK